LTVIINTEFVVENLLSLDEAVGSRVYEMCKDYVVKIERGREGNL